MHAGLALRARLSSTIVNAAELGGHAWACGMVQCEQLTPCCLQSMSMPSRQSINALVCSISVPSMASKSLLVTAGNMARDHEMRITFLGMHAAAAGLALQERRWFHISKASASRWRPAPPTCPSGNFPACQSCFLMLAECCDKGCNDTCDLTITWDKFLLPDAVTHAMCINEYHEKIVHASVMDTQLAGSHGEHSVVSLRAGRYQCGWPGCRLGKYQDLRQACEEQECEQILCVPILPQLPSGHTGRAGRAQPPRSAFGVLTLGFDDSVSVDAR